LLEGAGGRGRDRVGGMAGEEELPEGWSAVGSGEGAMYHHAGLGLTTPTRPKPPRKAAAAAAAVTFTSSLLAGVRGGAGGGGGRAAGAQRVLFQGADDTGRGGGGGGSGEAKAAAGDGPPPAAPLEEQLAFYGAYHRNFWNKAIHVVFVPVIMWSVLVWAAYTGPFAAPDLAAGLPAWFPLQLNLGFLLWLNYSFYYLYLEPVAGLSWAILMGLPLLLLADSFQAGYSGRAWLVALIAHVLGWYMQLHPGHAIFEGRKPALLDGLVQSFLTAPLFVWMEILFGLGYRPELQARLESAVEARLAAEEGGSAPAPDESTPLVRDAAAAFRKKGGNDSAV